MKRNFHLLLLVGAAFLASSCNTFIGFGRDIESLGSGMQNKAHGRDWNEGDRADAEPSPAPPSY